MVVGDFETSVRSTWFSDTKGRTRTRGPHRQETDHTGRGRRREEVLVRKGSKGTISEVGHVDILKLYENSPRQSNVTINTWTVYKE